MTSNTPQAPIASPFDFHSTAEDVVRSLRLDGKTVVITGGHSGIGLVATRVLSQIGARVLVGARDTEKARAALDGIANVECLPLDLAKPHSIDAFANQALTDFPSIDILINNAGVMALPETRDERGYEMQFATNHLGHFQLTELLLKAFNSNGGARVVTLTSAGHRFSPVIFDDINFKTHAYDKWKAYGQSKTANSLFAVELDRRLKQDGIRSFAVHPGRIVDTSLMRHMDQEEFKTASSASPAMIKTVEQGAATTLWAATSPLLAQMGGVYCADCQVAPIVDDISQDPTGVLNYAIDPALAQKLWSVSEEML